MKDSPAAAERVGRYQLLEPIGGGPNGMVARAKVFGVAGFERQFAVKRFASELTVGAIAQALSAAARSYGSLEHPRIARMSEFGVAQGQTFTAVEYVAGLDTFRLLQEAKLAGLAIAAGGALALVSQAARAVGYAHGRGLSHLGLAPTNVIVTADGDVKVTDFGILAATMPPRPIEAARLASRIPYLAPEQIAGESTSAATDVFVLGVIAYELVTGQRAYRGDTPAQIAHAIVSGPPAEPPLPRPIVRVLQRCLARSPFERFPDARALADALDAALRVAPVPGTRKDIGAQVKTTLERYAALNEGNLSGMVALNLQGQQPPLDAHDVSTQPFTRGDHARTDVSPVVPSAASTMPEMPKPFSTMPGLAPPPIPVPPGVTPPPGPPPAAAAGAAKTVLGLSPVKKPQVPSQIPSVVPPVKRPNGPPVKPPIPSSRATPPPMPVVKEVEEPSGLLEVTDLTPLPPPQPDHDVDDDGRMPAQDPATLQGIAPGPAAPSSLAPQVRLPRPTPGQNFESRTGEMSSGMLDELNKRSVKNTAELESLKPPHVDDPVDAFASEAKAVAADIVAEPPPAPVSMPLPAPKATGTIPVVQPARSRPTAPPPVEGGTALPVAAKKSKLPAVLLTLVLLGGLGAAGWYGYNEYYLKQDETPAVAKQDPVTTPDPGPAVIDPGPAVVDTGSAVIATPDAAAENTGSAAVVVAPADAAVAEATSDATPSETPQTTKPTATSDSLEVASKPKGARVYIDGADQGTTPVKLPGSTDRHTMVLFLPGHDLYIGEVDGSGVFNVDLKPVTPSGGHAGIKVLRCKAKERYYVYVDGKPTGMTCPTERIDTVVGPHTVEVYDIVTDSRRAWDIVIKDTRLSYRIKIED